VVGITAKHLGPPPHFVEIGHDFPAPLDPPDADAIGAAAVQALRALGLGWGPAHVELRLTSAGPRIVEVNPRLAGGMIPRMVEEALGVDLIDQVVRTAAGQGVPVRPERCRPASIRFLLAPRSGRLVELTGVPDALAVPGVVEVAITPGVVPGKEIVLRNAFTDRLAAVIATDADGSVAASAADKGVQALSAAITDTAKET
jgi:biotin carboxylase